MMDPECLVVLYVIELSNYFYLIWRLCVLI